MSGYKPEHRKPRPRAARRARPAPDKLTPIDERLVLEYLANGENATAAYKSVHPNSRQRSAEVLGSRLLRKVEVAAFIDREQAGRLQVTAELQNHYNHVTLSLTDNWGFSAGKLDVMLKLFIAFVLPLSASQYSKVLFTETLTSHGDNTNSVMPDTEALYKWDRTSEESFDQGEVVQVLVGSEVYAATWLDDMRARAGSVRINGSSPI